MQHEIQINCNIRIKLRVIFSNIIYFSYVSYIIDFLKVQNAQLYQVESHLNQTYALPKDT